MRDLQSHANPCNSLIITRKEVLGQLIESARRLFTFACKTLKTTVPDVSVGGFISRRRAICGQVLPLPLDRRGSVHSCSQYVTRPPFWHTQRTPPSWEITTATDPGSALASR